MTGGGDTDEVEDLPAPAGADDTLELPIGTDPDPTAGASDIGGRAGGDDD